MTPRKSGLVTHIKRFMEAMGERYQRALQVIDEALHSEDFKERKWVVDLLLKWVPDLPATPQGSKPEPGKPAARDPLADIDTSLMSDQELLRTIRAALDGDGEAQK